MFSGRKIAIIGPSNSGKSTLADRMGTALSLPVLHLDRLAHRAGTNWERRPDEDLVRDHDTFLSTHDAWVIEGNYSVCMPTRLRQADTVIWCDPPLAGCVLRYVLRCLQPSGGRVGGLEGAVREFNFGLIPYTLRVYPKNRKRYELFISKNDHLALYHFKRFRDIKAFGRSFALPSYP
jgi:hypothetical protein